MTVQNTMTNTKHILKVIVGSQAHGLANKDSDFDFRGVFIYPTSQFFLLPRTKLSETSWIEGKSDDTSWELGHFLDLATRCNPTILECFMALRTADDWKESLFFKDGKNVGEALKELFPYIWNSKNVYDAFTNYSKNQEKKMLDEKDGRPWKYAQAYLRVLYHGYELLTTGKFHLQIVDTPIYPHLKSFKEKRATFGEVVDICQFWKAQIKEAYEENPDKQTDFDRVNEFYQRVRLENWE